MTRRRPARALGLFPRGGAVVVLAACLALPAGAAQQEEPPDPDLSTEGMRRAGPFYLRPFVALKDAGYDDNIRLEGEGEAESDVTATLGPGLDTLLLTGDRGGIFLSTEFDYVAFRDHSDLNHWNNYTRARGIYLTKRAALSLENRFISVRERPNFEIDQRLRRDENIVTGAVRSLQDRRLGYRAFVRHRRIDYSRDEGDSEDVARRLNRREATFSLTGELRVRPKTTFLLEGVYARAEFDDSSEGRDTRAVSVLPGFRFDPSAAIQGEFKIGVISLEAPERPQSDYHGTVGEARLSTRLGNRIRLKGTFERDLRFSTLHENLYYIRTHWTAAYEQFFSRRLSTQLLYGEGENRYPEEVTRGGGEPFSGIREDRITTYELSVRYRISDQFSLRARALRQERDSTDDFFDRDRNFYAFGSSYAF
ncbi:MAG: outer membrane beta-barrel protein [Acidobacteriota bacterium]